MLNLIVKYHAKDSISRVQFVSELMSSGAAASVRAEDGCIRYDYYYSAEDECEVLLFEQWESKEKQEVHMTQPHMATIKGIKEKYIESTELETL